MENNKVKPQINFGDVLNEIDELHRKKNQDYGNAFGETLQKAGIGYSVGTLLVKANRFASIVNKDKPNFESIEDTLLDIASYAVMTLVELRNVKISSKGGCNA